VSLSLFRVDQQLHTMAGLHLLAQDGAVGIEAFISRRVMDVWAESIEHTGGRQSLLASSTICWGN
jgi:hypothetical protein